MFPYFLEVKYDKSNIVSHRLTGINLIFTLISSENASLYPLPLPQQFLSPQLGRGEGLGGGRPKLMFFMKMSSLFHVKRATFCLPPPKTPGSQLGAPKIVGVEEEGVEKHLLLKLWELIY